MPVFEAMIDAAARSNEDRKSEVIANAFVSIAFDPGISIADALLYLDRIRACSWRQLVALQYLQAGGRGQERELLAVTGEEGDIDIAPALSAEFSELGSTLELVGAGLPGGRVSNPRSTFGGAQMTTKSVASMTPTILGREVIRLGRLDQVVGDAELDEIARGLS
jgi:hypothetical protein